MRDSALKNFLRAFLLLAYLPAPHKGPHTSLPIGLVLVFD